jgi:uncharacterized protein YndB with AHSA1/START domain
MPSMSGPASLEFFADRWFPATADLVWAQCTSKEGLESWWSPDDLRTTVKRIDPRPGGEVVLSLRFAPAILGREHEAAFQAAGVPIAFTLRGKFLEFEKNRRLTVALTLALDRAGAGVETVTQIDLEPESGGTRVRLVLRGTNEPHLLTLGRSNLEGQLERLGRSLGVPTSPPT